MPLTSSSLDCHPQKSDSFRSESKKSIFKLIQLEVQYWGDSAGKLQQ